MSMQADMVYAPYFLTRGYEARFSEDVDLVLLISRMSLHGPSARVLISFHLLMDQPDELCVTFHINPSASNINS